MDALVRHGLMPADSVDRKALEMLDPCELRTRPWRRACIRS